MDVIKEPLKTVGIPYPQHVELDYYQDRIADILRSAARNGVVITVSNPPRAPLAMGNYDLVVSARPLRNYEPT